MYNIDKISFEIYNKKNQKVGLFFSANKELTRTKDGLQPKEVVMLFLDGIANQKTPSEFKDKAKLIISKFDEYDFSEINNDEKKLTRPSRRSNVEWEEALIGTALELEEEKAKVQFLLDRAKVDYETFSKDWKDGKYRAKF